MSSRKCPVCDVSVKLENLERHIASVHPRERLSPALSEAERRTLHESKQKETHPFRTRRSTVVIVGAVAIILVVLGLALPYLPSPGHGSGEIIVHWHPLLTVTIDGRAVSILANIGINPDLWRDHSLDSYGMPGMAPLHTHDSSGKIHVESTSIRDFTIGEFFRIWGQTFDAQEVMGHPAAAGHRVWMVVDGNQLSPSYGQLLRDGMHIDIVCAAG